MLTGISLYKTSGASLAPGRLGSRGNESPLWRMQSLCSSVTSETVVLFPQSRKLASGGRTLTPVTVTEPSMAFRSWRQTAKCLTQHRRKTLPHHKQRKKTHLFEGDRSNQTSHAGHIGVIEAQQREDGVGLWKTRGGSWPEYKLMQGLDIFGSSSLLWRF